MKRAAILLHLLFLLLLLACKKENDSPDLQKGLQGYFNFDKDIKDSLHSDHEMFSKGVITGTKDRHDKASAMFFDGGVFSFKPKVPWNFSPLTVSVWVKPTALSQDNYFLIAMGTGLAFYQEYNALLLLVTAKTISADIAAGWTLVTATYDGRMMKLYVNGKFKTSAAYQEDDTLDGFMIGSMDIQTPVWKGALDELRFYDRVLTNEEIKLLANS